MAGFAFNWGALLGWSAVAGSVDWAVCLPLYAGGVCWTLVYDSIYAHQVRLSFYISLYIAHTNIRPQDKIDDVQAGIRSTALLFGMRTRPILSLLSLSSLGLISLAGHLNAQSSLFFCGVALAGVQLARVLHRTDFDARASCWRGFVGCGWAGFWVWLGALVDYIISTSGVA